MPTLRMGLKSCCCYHLNVHDLIVWTVAAAKSSVKTFWLETFAIPRTISYPNFSISWHNATIDVNDAQCETQNQFHFPKPVWKGMVKTATYKVTDLLYVQIALQIFIYDLQEQFPREGAIIHVCTSKEARFPNLFNWQCFTDHTWWLQTNILDQWLCFVILSQGHLMNEYFFEVFKHIPGLPRPQCCVLYFPTNTDTVSQPLNAWENDNVLILDPMT